MILLTVFMRFSLGTAPMTVSRRLPPLNSMIVGMDRMPYFVAVFGLSSVLSFTCMALKVVRALFRLETRKACSNRMPTHPTVP